MRDRLPEDTAAPTNLAALPAGTGVHGNRGQQPSTYRQASPRAGEERGEDECGKHQLACPDAPNPSLASLFIFLLLLLLFFGCRSVFSHQRPSRPVMDGP